MITNDTLLSTQLFVNTLYFHFIIHIAYQITRDYHKIFYVKCIMYILYQQQTNSKSSERTCCWDTRHHINHFKCKITSELNGYRPYEIVSMLFFAFILYDCIMQFVFEVTFQWGALSGSNFVNYFITFPNKRSLILMNWSILFRKL